jgi:hypothetical protein
VKLLQLSSRAKIKILDLCTTFFLDASVLTFVFPVLDTIVERGRRSLTSVLFIGTLGISGVFFLLAILLAVMMAEREES